MIDRLAFAKVMGGFADRIGRALAPETSDMYYDVLSSALSTDEFLAGARIVFRSHSYNTWPAPQQFIDAGRPAVVPALDAGEAFERVLEIVNRTTRTPNWSDRLTEVLALGPVVERAFRAAGGRRDMENAPLDSVPFIRRRFVEAYEHASESEAHAADLAGALASVQAPRIGEMESGAALVVKGLAQLKSMPLTGRDRATGEHRDSEAADD